MQDLTSLFVNNPNLALLITISTAIALTIGLVEVAKRLGLNTKFAPLAALVFGLGIGFLATPAHTDFRVVLLLGIMVGLSAAGLYSGVKATSAASGANQ